jgi:membrane fusion protein (multidrug efflux system)
MPARSETNVGPIRRAWRKKPSTLKRMLVMIVCVLLLVAALVGFKVMSIMKMMAGMKPPPPAVVTTAKAAFQEWQPSLSAVGTLRAVRGADLALDVAGLVTSVNIKSGDDVKQGQVLLQLRDSEDVAQLHQLEAAASLAEVTFNRARQQLAVKAISQADYDAAAADLKGKQAAVQQQQVNVSKKTLRAPFAGRAGNVTANPGMYMNSGTTIVTVQELDPLYVDFMLPQRELGSLHVGQKVSLSLDAFPDKHFEGELNAISPKVDADTRNIEVEAKVGNADHALMPGMFANVSLETGGSKRYLTLPQTAVVFNPYGETVFVVRKKAEFDRLQAADAAKNADAKSQAAAPAKAPNAPPIAADALVVQQTFVTTNGTRGDQIAITGGLSEGDEVVTSGQLKLKNGAQVTIDNSKPPPSNPNPTPQEK